MREETKQTDRTRFQYACNSKKYKRKNEENASGNANHISAHTEQQGFRTARDAKAVTDELHMSATKQ
jgi:hypothetical protein